ncbi:MAG: dihydrofolate reductase family protein [Pseudomonadota bacterium]
MSRPRCSVFVATSLDGYLADPDDGLAWLESVNSTGEDFGFDAFIARVDGVVLGRRTYDVVTGFDAWPYPGKHCVVLSHRPAEPRHGEQFFQGTPGQLVAELGVQGLRRIYVDGGQVIRQFLQAALVDDLTLSLVPLVLGRGIPLFTPELELRRLKLLRSQAFKSGLVQLEYHLESVGG